MTLVSLIICGIGGYFAWDRIDIPRTAGRIEEVAARAQRLGIPLHSDELKPNPPVRKEDNAAPLILAAAKAAQEMPEPEKLGEDMERWPPKVREALRLAHLAAKKPRCDFGIDYDYGASITFRFPESTRPLLKAMVLETGHLAKAGKVDAALKGIDDLNSLASHCGTRRDMVGYLVRSRVSSYVSAAAERVAFAVQDEVRALRLLQVALAKYVEPNPVPYVQGEAFLMVASLRNNNLDGPREEADSLAHGDQIVREGWPESMVLRAMMVRQLELSCETIEALNAHQGDWLEAKGVLARSRKTRDEDPHVSRRLSEVFDPGYDLISDSYGERLARREAVKALIAVLIYKAIHHRYPIHLSDAGITAIDPFADKPLQYRVNGDEVRIWSVGRNRIDEGGRRPKEISPIAAKRGNKGDVVASIPPGPLPR